MFSLKSLLIASLIAIASDNFCLGVFFDSGKLGVGLLKYLSISI
jgi:hypothetical protein